MVDNLTRFEALTRAIDTLGSQAAMARLCEVSPTAVWKWVQSSKQLPTNFVLRVEAATGVSRHDLRPDIYPIEHPCPPVRFYGVDRGATRVSFNRQPVLKANVA